MVIVSQETSLLSYVIAKINITYYIYNLIFTSIKYLVQLFKNSYTSKIIMWILIKQLTKAKIITQ